MATRDPDDPRTIDWPTRQRNARVWFDVVDGHPVCPFPTEARRGRGGFGHWGERACVDMAITCTVDGIRRIVLTRNPEGAKAELGWRLPGGGIDGQTTGEAASRETSEETGLFVHPGWWGMTPPRYVPDQRGTRESWAVTVLCSIDLGATAELPPLRPAEQKHQAAWFAAGDIRELIAAVHPTGVRIFPAHLGMLIGHLRQPTP